MNEIEVDNALNKVKTLAETNVYRSLLRYHDLQKQLIELSIYRSKAEGDEAFLDMIDDGISFINTSLAVIDINQQLYILNQVGTYIRSNKDTITMNGFNQPVLVNANTFPKGCIDFVTSN